MRAALLCVGPRRRACKRGAALAIAGADRCTIAVMFVARWWWLALATGSSLATACAPACVDDGLHARQGGAACVVATTTTETTTATTATTAGSTTTQATTGPGDTSTPATTGTSGSGSGDASSSSGSTSSTGGSSSGSSSGDDSSTGLFHCLDDLQSGDETDVNCGGGACDPCVDGLKCEVATDCMSQACNVVGFCVPAHCTNGEHDPGLEAHVDCGGECGATCGLGFVCVEDTDCLAGSCLKNRCVLDPHCADDEELAPPQETDVDCGGECGATCKFAQGCLADADCYSNDCEEVCQLAPHCLDDMQNFGETDVNCGGPCPGCFPDLACVGDSDCASGLTCTDFFCTII